MLTINTNLSSYIVQRNLTYTTNVLNQTIERMSTGYKINHASDNAANYSIATNYNTKISSYNIASSNISSGLDLLATAQDTLSLMQNHASRLHALVTQARNGTYNDQSLSSLNSEAAGIIAEINRLYNSAEFNGIKLFRSNKTPEMELPDWVYELNDKLDTSRYKGFILNPVTKSQAYVDSLTHVSELSDFTAYAEYQVSTKEDLKRLAELVNSNKSTQNVKFYMGADIDLEGETWIPIGNRSANSSYQFKGMFDGNGHVIKNFKVNNTSKDYQGLFGHANNYASIKNLGVENAEIKGKGNSGILAGTSDGTITNCYVTGNVQGGDKTGGLAGAASKSITYSHARVSVSGKQYVGGLVGYTTNSVSNCFSDGTVIATSDYAGGLMGYMNSKINNCYSNANVTGKSYTSGLAGRTVDAVTNAYATGNVSGNLFVGGIMGVLKKTSGTLSIDKIMSLGIVTGNDKTGCLIGGIENTYNGGQTFSTIHITNGYVLEQRTEKIGGTYTSETGNAPVPYDMTEWLDNITYLYKPKPADNIIGLQVGIYGDETSKIAFDTSLDYDLSYILENGLQADGAYDSINTFIQTISAKSTELGAVSNRLESALDSVNTSIRTSTSSLSTIRDADIAKVSSKYIQHQILQQAAATLLATANQSPNIALQLISLPKIKSNR